MIRCCLCVSATTPHCTMRLERSMKNTLSAAHRCHFRSQRVDRMNLDLAEELKVVRKSSIALAPEAGTERMRAVINKGLSHEQNNLRQSSQRINPAGRPSSCTSCADCRPKRDDDLEGIIQILDEATRHCHRIRNTDRAEVQARHRIHLHDFKLCAQAVYTVSMVRTIHTGRNKTQAQCFARKNARISYEKRSAQSHRR